MTADNKTAGLYVHIPFCSGKCVYCDFYSFRPDEETKEKYIEKICGDIKKSPYVFDTVYIGGGTPSFMGEKALAKIVSCAETTRGAEVTVECNPYDTGRKDKAFDFSLLSQAGVNRISLGLQSAVDSERRALGRRAGSGEALRAIERACAAGIENISLDLMLGIPFQTARSLEASLEFCVSSGAKHISAYILKIEPGTFLASNPEKFTLPDDDTAADFYLKASEYLESKGFSHYEISNFALPGFESRHNLKYWTGKDYLGLGPSAHSLINGKRYYYPRSTEEYLRSSAPVSDGEGGGAQEYLMLSLRLSRGISLNELKKEYGVDADEKFTAECRKFASAGLAEFDGERLRLNSKGFLVSNSVISSLLCLID